MPPATKPPCSTDPNPQPPTPKPQPIFTMSGFTVFKGRAITPHLFLCSYSLSFSDLDFGRTGVGAHGPLGTRGRSGRLRDAGRRRHGGRNVGGATALLALDADDHVVLAAQQEPDFGPGREVVGRVNGAADVAARADRPRWSASASPSLGWHKHHSVYFGNEGAVESVVV